MKSKRIKFGDRISGKKEAEKLLRDARKLSRELLSLESIPDIRQGIYKIELFYRRAIQRIMGDDKLYVSIKEDAVYRFGMITDDIRERFRPGNLVKIAEDYRQRYL